MYRDTITLFNRYDSATGIIWYPSILRNVDVNIDRGAVVAKFGEQSTDNAILHVRYELTDSGKLISGKRYLPPKEWAAQLNDLLPTSVTFKSGEDFDFFYLGEYGNGGTISDEEYERGSTFGFYEYMNKNFDHVYAISNVSEYSLIPHLEISAR